MPTMRDFRGQQDARKQTRSKSTAAVKATPVKKTAAKNKKQVKNSSGAGKRRPGREDHLMEGTIEMSMNSVNQKTKEAADLKPEDVAYFEAEAEAQAERDTPKVEIQFKGSELLRSRFPKPFDLAEAVATDWTRGGQFENLPISHPLAQWMTQKSLLKAKEIEKKVMESPALEKAAMKALTVGMKAQGFVQQMRDRLKR